MTAVLPKSEIRRLINDQPHLVEDFVNIDEQLQPNGFDLTLRGISMLQSSGVIPVDNNRRVISALGQLYFDGIDYIDLLPGAYVVTFNEVVNLPDDIMALGKPRSSLLRCGVAIHNAIWDAGYHGRSQALMVVYNTLGFKVQKNARVLQLIFLRLSASTEGYNGIYQGKI